MSASTIKILCIVIGYIISHLMLSLANKVIIKCNVRITRLFDKLPKKLIFIYYILVSLQIPFFIYFFMWGTRFYNHIKADNIGSAVFYLLLNLFGVVYTSVISEGKPGTFKAKNPLYDTES